MTLVSIRTPNTRYGDKVSVLYGRCAHRRALMSDGHVDGVNLICGVHGWDYRLDTGVSEYNNHEALRSFKATIDLDDDASWIDTAEVDAFAAEHPQEFERDQYLGLYADVHGGPEEDQVNYIHGRARDGLDKLGHHGVVSAMGVPRSELPQWTSIQIVTGQLATQPLLDDHPVSTELVIGPGAAKPLRLEIPIWPPTRRRRRPGQSQLELLVLAHVLDVAGDHRGDEAKRLPDPGRACGPVLGLLRGDLQQGQVRVIGALEEGLVRRPPQRLDLLAIVDEARGA